VVKLRWHILKEYHCRFAIPLAASHKARRSARDNCVCTDNRHRSRPASTPIPASVSSSRRPVIDHSTGFIGRVSGIPHRIDYRGTSRSAYDGTAKQSNLPLCGKRKLMADLGAILAQLKQERAKLDKAIEALSSVAGKSGGGRRGTHRLSAAARARIAAAQRARWAKFKAKKAR
jgi:hypothetical protein